MIRNVKQLRDLLGNRKAQPRPKPVPVRCVRLRVAVRLTIRGFILPAGTIGQIIEETATRQLIRFPGGLFASVPVGSDLVLVETVK